MTRERRANRCHGLCACGEHAWAVLSKGYVTFVSPEDAHILGQANWRVRINGELAYAIRTVGAKIILLHRVILGRVAGKPPDETDHKDHNGLNNHRGKLRPCEHGQNLSDRRFPP